jgi:flavin-dependent dehydrogenase
LQGEHRQPKEYLAELNLKPEFNNFSIQKVFFSTQSRDMDLTLKEPLHLLQRGGVNSLEYGLYRQALDLNVEFKFNQLLTPKDVDIVATGPKRVEAAGYGEIYENDSFPKDHFFMMYDDRYSPRGWYLYAVPYDGKIVIMNCLFQPYVSQAKTLLKKAVKEKKILRDIVGDKKPLEVTGGFGNASIPETAVINGKYIIGEAAGFQDPFRGFGMKFALESGKIAADTITHNLDYDELWKKRFMPQIKANLSRRLFLWLFGGALVDLLYLNTKSGDTINFITGDIKGPAGNLLKDIFYRTELLKKRVTGYW